MKLAGTFEFQALPHLPSSVDTPTVRITCGLPPFFVKQFDVPVAEAEEAIAMLQLAVQAAKAA